MNTIQEHIVEFNCNYMYNYWFNEWTEKQTKYHVTNQALTWAQHDQNNQAQEEELTIKGRIERK